MRILLADSFDKSLPGRLAKFMQILPVGYDEYQSVLRIAIAGPANFHAQEAIRRMLQKKILAYIGNQSAIESLLDRLYQPDERDLEGMPSYGALDELLTIGHNLVGTAIEHHAENVQMELLADLFWARFDFHDTCHHFVYRRIRPPAQERQMMPSEGRPAAGQARV